MGSDKARPAYVEEEDEACPGKTVRGTRRSAVNKEKPKVHRETRPGKSGSRRQAESTYPDTNLAQHIEVANKEKAVKLERRGSTSSSTKSPRKSTRPPSAHGNRSYPPLAIPNSASRPESTFYGVPPSSPAVRTPGVSHQNLALRPRAQTSQTYPRPSSYYSATASQASAGPPLSYSAFYQNPLITPSYPPPSPSSSYMRYAATPQPTAPQYSIAPAYQQTIAGGADYFTPHAMSRPLASRFDPIARTQSAMDTVPRTSSSFGRDINPRGVHETYSYEAPSGGYYDDGYASANEVVPTIRRKDRRGSVRGPPAPSTFSKHDADTIAMPPPGPRPGILRRTTADYSIEPVSSQDLEYRDARTQYRDEPRGPARRPSVNRHSVSYDLDRSSDGVRIEPANTGRRRQSWYDGAPASSGTGTGASSAYEDKLNQATHYQEDVGGPTVPLTAEVLRRQQRREAGSSRSTKSSASRDESDYKKSATTRTTRSGSNDDENVTIKVTGQARVMVGGAQIDCTDGGAIEIKRNQRLSRNGSERSSSEFGDKYENRRIEDRQSRVTRPSARSRMSSQSGESYTRRPQYPPMDNYI